MNGERIEDLQIKQEVERLRPHYEQTFSDKKPKEREAQLLDWSRENVIERVLINQHAREFGPPISETEVESALVEMKKQYENQGRSFEKLSAEDKEKIREALESQIKVERLLQSVCKDIPEPSRESIAEYYEENKEQFRTPEQIRVAHIVKYINWQTDEKSACDAIKQAREEVNNGIAFELLVDKYTDCPDSGGDLGYITKGQMVEEFEDVVFKLGSGEVSDVFRTRFGFHIAKLYDRKPAVLLSTEEVKGRIAEELKEQVRRKAVDEFVDKLKDKAKIEEM